MEPVVLENVLLDKIQSTITLSAEGLEFRNHEQKNTIRKDSVKNMEIFRATKKYCLRVATEANIYDILNVDEGSIGRLRSAANTFFGMTLATTELEVLNTTEGNFAYNNNILSLHSEKPVFAIPRANIHNIIEIENDLQFNLKDVEIVFNTTSNVTSFLKSKILEEVCVIPNITCTNPRSKSVLLFFEEFFEAKGSSYDHCIMYSDVKEMLFLSSNESEHRADAEHHMVLRLETPIVQGQTKYESMVFLLNKTEIEVAAKDSRLNEYYKGEQSDVVMEIMEALLGKKAQLCDLSVRCTNKINDGALFFVGDTLQFLPKSVSIDANAINLVEFCRLNVSALQAKTFDVVLHADKIYNFTSITKEHYAAIEAYFGEKGIKMVTEAVEEDFSTESIDERSEDDSEILSIIANSDEDD